MKRYLSLLSGVVLLLILLFAESTVIEAAQIIEVSGDNAIIDSTYSFAPRFIPGVSWAEIYGCTDYSSTDELYRNSSANSGRLPQHSHVAKLTNDAVVRSGTIGVRYYKVGVYEETAVDLKIMLVGGEVRSASADKYPNSNIPGIAIMDNDIDIYQQSYHTRDLQWQFTFYQHGTNTEMRIPFHANFKDIDYTEFLDFSYGGISSAYIRSSASGGKLSHTATRVSSSAELSGDNDKENWATLLGNASSFRIMYARSLEHGYESWDKSSNSRSFYHWKWSSDSLVRFNTPSITKQINNTSSVTIANTAAFSYTMQFSVPNENPASYYTVFQVSDVLENCIELVDGVNSISVKDANGNDVTSRFRKTLQGQTVQLTLADPNDAAFYGNSYTVTLLCRRKASYDMSAWYTTAGVGSVGNRASITTDRGTKTTNTVQVDFLFRIDTAVTNGTITSSKTDVRANTAHSIYYAPSSSDYKLDAVLVDGKVVDTAKNPTSYTFSGMKENHSITARYRRVYHIDTEVKAGSGTISESINEIEKGTGRTITYRPSEGYYLRRIYVDGKEVDLNAYSEQYTFTDIQADHRISVEFLPIPRIELTKQIQRSELYLPSGNPTFIFRIEGEDYVRRHHVYYEVLSFTEEDLHSKNRDKLQKTIQLKHIPAGEYTIREVKVSRYHLIGITDIVSGKQIDDAVILNTDGKEEAKATFINTRKTYHNYSHNDLIVNEFPAQK